MAAKMPPPGYGSWGKGDTDDFSSTQVALPPEIAQHLIAHGAAIPNSELTEDGREKEPHVTVKYGLHGSDPKPVADALAGESPAKLKLRKTSLFKSPEHEVLIVEIDSPDLRRLNKKVEGSGPFTDTHPGYHPHATIAYLKPGKGDKYAGLQRFEGMEATAPSVTFSSKDGSRTEIPLNGGTMAKKRMKPPPTGQLGPGDYGSLPDIKIPHEAVTDPPGPDATAAMAAGGEDVVRGNSNRQVLTPDGAGEVAKTGANLARLGGVDRIIASPATRTMETAHAVQQADPKSPPIAADPQIESHALGQLEGEPKTPEVRKFLADLVRKNPDYKIPGQGALSTRPGESFNEFRTRALSGVRGIMQALAQNPHQAMGVPKHSQVSKLVHGWIANGLPDDLSVDPKAFLSGEDPKPGEVEKFAPDAQGKWSMDKFDPEKETSLPKGAIYFIEHGETPGTSADASKVSAGQRARAQIITAIRAGDWKGAQKAAKAAMGVLSGEEIEAAIDEAIPGAEEAAGLEPHQLLPLATAASPAKRAELAPVLNQKFADLSTVEPQGQRELRSHLGRIRA